MKILITGMTSRQTHEQSRDGFITISGALANILRRLDHEVVVDAYSIKDSLADNGDKYDLVFVGLGPLKGLGTAYMYQALQAIVDNQDSVILYVDDTDTAKMGREFRTVLKRPFDYLKPFFMYKREWDVVSSNKSVLDSHLEIINILAGYTTSYWPLLVPSWSFDLAYTAGGRICGRAADAAVSFDPSSEFAIDLSNGNTAVEIDRELLWGTTWKSTSTAISKMGVFKWEVETIDTYSKFRFSHVGGVLSPSFIWAPEITIATSVGTPVAADWRELGPQFGDPFEELPANIEMMSQQERDQLAVDQHSVLISRLTDPTKIIEELVNKYV